MKIFDSSNIYECFDMIEKDKYAIRINETDPDFECASISFDKEENFITFYSSNQIFVHSLDKKKREIKDTEGSLDYKIDENIYQSIHEVVVDSSLSMPGQF